MINTPKPEPLASNRRVTTCYPDFCRSTKIGVRFGVHSGQATRKPLLHLQLRMEPVAGFEPATDGLQNRCSTTELNWLKILT